LETCSLYRSQLTEPLVDRSQKLKCHYTLRHVILRSKQKEVFHWKDGENTHQPRTALPIPHTCEISKVGPNVRLRFREASIDPSLEK
jgi:hypothetical protein